MWRKPPPDSRWSHKVVAKPNASIKLARVRYVDGSFRRADTLHGFVNLID